MFLHMLYTVFYDIPNFRRNSCNSCDSGIRMHPSVTILFSDAQGDISLKDKVKAR